jgi:tetratricopeptide (TPR) repeat protein
MASRGKAKQAEENYRAALAKAAGYLPARHNLALLAAGRKGKVDGREEAIRIWREILAGDAEFLPSRLSLAETLAATGNLAQAIKEYSLILKQRPDYLSAHVARLRLHGEQRDWRSVEVLSREALVRWPGEPALMEIAGDALVALGRGAEAARLYRAAVDRPLESRVNKRLIAKLRKLSIQR